MAKWLTNGSVKRAGEGTTFDSSRCGLFLWVRGSSRRYYQSITIKGERTKIAIGNPLLVSAEEARQKAINNLAVAKGGGDPRKPKSDMHKLHDVVFKGATPTFKLEAERVIKLKSSGWKDAKGIGRKWRSTLEKYAYPTIGDMPVNEITRQDVKAILEPHWTEINPTMRKLRQRMGEIFKVSLIDGHVTHNPAGDEILTVLPSSNGGSSHHKALQGSKVKEAIRTIRSSTSYAGARLCLEFVVLTACRSGEVRAAQWDEIDEGKSVWTIPAERMKSGKQHRVPLSIQAVSVLREAKRIGLATRKVGLIFPSQSGRLQDGAMLSRLLKKEKIDSSVHGFRTSFSSYLNENNYNADAIEACLAHTTQGVRGAYMRGDFFEQRREIMNAWAKHLT